MSKRSEALGISQKPRPVTPKSKRRKPGEKTRWAPPEPKYLRDKNGEEENDESKREAD